MSQVQQLTVGPDQAEQRLDRWFRRQFPHISQVQIEKLCRKGEIRVDGGRVKAASRVAPCVAGEFWVFYVSIWFIISFVSRVFLSRIRPDGGIGRRTRFRSWRWQHCGGSSPFLGTIYSLL